MEELAKNEKLVEIIQSTIAEARADGLDDEDAKWMAVGAVNAEARAQGLAGDALPAEFNAAALALVEQEMKKK